MPPRKPPQVMIVIAALRTGRKRGAASNGPPTLTSRAGRTMTIAERRRGEACDARECQRHHLQADQAEQQQVEQLVDDLPEVEQPPSVWSDIASRLPRLPTMKPMRTTAIGAETCTASASA